jgi:hypothetical protein
MNKAMRAVDEEEGPWSVAAEFRAPIVLRPAITATYTGAEALNSGPYKAVQAYLEACRKNDLEAIRNTLNSNAQQLPAKYEAAQGKQAVLKIFTEEAAETAKMKLSKAIVRGDSAELIFSSGSGDSRLTQTLRTVLEDGVWKYGQ